MQGNGTRRSITMETFGNQEGQPEVALRTIPIVLKNGNRRIIVNCLLDEGSDTTYVDEDVVKEIGLNLKFDQNVYIFVFPKSYTSGIEECYAECFRVNIALFHC